MKTLFYLMTHIGLLLVISNLTLFILSFIGDFGLDKEGDYLFLALIWWAVPYAVISIFFFKTRKR